MSAKPSNIRKSIIFALIGMLVGMIIMVYISNHHAKKLIQIQSDIGNLTIYTASISDYLADAINYNNGKVTKEYLLTETMKEINLFRVLSSAELLTTQLEEGIGALETESANDFYQYVEATIQPSVLEVIEEEKNLLKHSLSDVDLKLPLLFIVVILLLLVGILLFDLYQNKKSA